MGPTITPIHQDEEHLVRRLGAAVVLVWDQLSDKNKASIQRAALDTLDEYQTVGLNAQVSRFITDYAGKIIHTKSRNKSLAGDG